MNDTDWFIEKLKEQKKSKAEDLKRAKATAKEIGKEPFDFQKLFTLYDITSDFVLVAYKPSKNAEFRYEEKYYLSYPDILSIEEFAERLETLDIYNP